jgi:nitroimidazol reductase NimA-like FMN-containing flavoprotein (pyridoxamine 5'-phosphate oxidase superfamily)
MEIRCNWEMEQRFVIGFGEASIVDGPEEKRRALTTIVERYSGDPCVNHESAARHVTVVEVQTKA